MSRTNDDRRASSARPMAIPSSLTIADRRVAKGCDRRSTRRRRAASGVLRRLRGWFDECRRLVVCRSVAGLAALLIAVFGALAALGCAPPPSSAVRCSIATSLGCALQSVDACSEAVMSWNAYGRCIVRRSAGCAADGLTRCAWIGVATKERRLLLHGEQRCSQFEVLECVRSAGQIETKDRALETVATCYHRLCGVSGS